MTGVTAANEQSDRANTAQEKALSKMDRNSEDSGMNDPEDASGRRRR